MKPNIPSWLRIPILFFAILGLIEFFVDSGNQPALMKQPLIMLFLLLILLIIIGIDAVVGAMDSILYQSLDAEAKALYKAKKEKTPKFITWLQKTFKKLGGVRSLQEEHEIVMDHNYDGIQELDNNLPPWWKYGFYASIIFAIVYMLKYEVFNADNQYDELDTEYAEAKAAIEIYKKNAKDLVDFNTVEVLTDASDLGNGKKIFEENCVACHKMDGGGGIGPNLTDNHWILGGGIKHVFKTISEGGRDGKGMIAWSKNGLKPLEIAQVASYVLQFQGTTPAEPKAAEGDIIWPEKTPSAENQ
ncbi:MAG: cbb3-type cytochrome c oxidase N-terminal domain-containing protein [Gelidibacter sp.]